MCVDDLLQVIALTHCAKRPATIRFGTRTTSWMGTASAFGAYKKLIHWKGQRFISATRQDGAHPGGNLRGWATTTDFFPRCFSAYRAEGWRVFNFPESDALRKGVLMHIQTTTHLMIAGSRYANSW